MGPDRDIAPIDAIIPLWLSFLFEDVSHVTSTMLLPIDRRTIHSNGIPHWRITANHSCGVAPVTSHASAACCCRVGTMVSVIFMGMPSP